MDLKGLATMISGMVSKEVSKDRWDICSNCDKLTSRNRCKECGCFMIAKVKFKKASCPLGHWSTSE